MSNAPASRVYQPEGLPEAYIRGLIAGQAEPTRRTTIHNSLDQSDLIPNGLTPFVSLATLGTDFLQHTLPANLTDSDIPTIRGILRAHTGLFRVMKPKEKLRIAKYTEGTTLQVHLLALRGIYRGYQGKLFEGQTEALLDDLGHYLGFVVLSERTGTTGSELQILDQ